MREVKEINIKSAYYYFDDMVNIEGFHSDLLEIDKKLHKDIDIYYIGYIAIKKFGVNPLHLIIHSTTGYFKEKSEEKDLIIDSIEKYEEVFSGIRSEIKTLNVGKELFYEKKYSRIGVDTDDGLPLNKQLEFPTLTIISRCIFQEGKKLYPQIYLDNRLHEL